MNFRFLSLALFTVHFFNHLAFAKTAFDDRAHLPASFSVQGKSAVFADFQTARYELTYDFNRLDAYADSEISLITKEDGMIVFDSVEEPVNVVLDGRPVQSVLVDTPDGATQVRVVRGISKAGTHVLRLRTPLSHASFDSAVVENLFGMTDLTDRSYLEKYLPANFIFDRVAMRFLVKLVGASPKLKVYTNGVLSTQDAQNFEVAYPAYFTASSLYFHLVPEAKVEELRFDYPSVSKKNLPVVVYVNRDIASQDARLNLVQKRVSIYLAQLEAELGAFIHPALTIYLTDRGMEYCGAIMSDESALKHELFHSYVARGVEPANGNAGWIDEALAVWWSRGMPVLPELSGNSPMGAQSIYTRTTDTNAYDFGFKFMAYLNGKLKPQGGLKAFLLTYIPQQKFVPYTTTEFATAMSAFYHLDLTREFQQFTENLQIRQY